MNATTRFVLTPIAAAATLGLSAAAFAHTATPAGANEITLDQIQSNRVMAMSSRNMTANATSVIDLVAFYQPTFATMLGDEAVHARIQYKVDVANEVLANSGANAMINLVAVLPTLNIPDELGFNEETNIDDITVYGAGDLFSNFALNYAPGHTENELYASYGADLVTYFHPYRLFMEGADANLGSASLGGEVTFIIDKFAENPLLTYQDETLAHEIGHNLGAGHEEGATDSSWKDADAHAYECGGNRTVMWSVGSRTQARHRFLSSPSASVDGEYCGVAGQADNTAVVQRNAPIAASRRDAPSILGGVRMVDSSITANESDGEFTVNLVRSGDTSEPAAVGVLIKGDTLSTVRDLKQAYQFVEFEAGESDARATFGVIHDAVEQGDMTGSVHLVYPNRLDIETSAASLTIVDSPAGNPGEIVINAPKRITPGDDIEIELVRTGGLDGGLLVQLRPEYDFLETFTGELMYPALDNVIFADGQDRMTITIPTNAIEIDNDRSYGIKATMPALDKTANALVVIDSGTTTYSVSNGRAVSTASAASVTITRSGDTSQPSGVYIQTLDGSLNDAEHYMPTAEWVRFNRNETSVNVRIPLRSSTQAGSFSVELDTGESATVQLTQAATPGPGQEDDVERQGAFTHPWQAVLLVGIAMWLRVRRRKVC